MLAILLGTHLFYPDDASLHRYDAITISAVIIQYAMLVLRLETLNEAKVIMIFHIVGTIMEIFKTSVGSWIYAEDATLQIMGVPLFSGFMYAAVGSYIARIWRIFDMKFSYYPPLWMTGLLAIATYVNFFTHHYLADIRILLFGACLMIYWRSWVYFRVFKTYRTMPLLIGFLLVALFIFFAENLGTLAKAWTYPDQEDGWRPVHIAKLGSWYLLMIISFVLITLIQKPEKLQKQSDN